MPYEGYAGRLIPSYAGLVILGRRAADGAPLRNHDKSETGVGS
jgi:hypothetical protein